MSQSDFEIDGHEQRLHGLFTGYVKENRDFQRMGRLGVWIPELNSSDTELVNVMYGTPFGGATNFQDIGDNVQSFDQTQKSYGFWAVPPDINNVVLVMFINGHISKGVWIGSLFQQYANSMVPNMPVGETYQREGKAPTAEFNRNQSVANNPDSNPRPYHKPHYDAVRNQGLKDDPVRGFSQHGARAEDRSRVSGMLSPGGHYWSIEDTQDDEKVRIRTKSGTQLLLDETNGMVYIINKSGKGWVEVDNEGKIMIYGEQGIAMRSKGDINLHADNDLIFESGRNIFMKSGGNTNLENFNFYHKTKKDQVVNVAGIQTEKLGKQHTKSESEIQVSATDKYVLGTTDYNVNASASLNMSSGADTNLNSGANTNLSAASNASFTASTNMTLTAAMLVKNASLVTQNSGGGGGAAKTADPTSLQITNIPDLKTFDKKDVEQPHSEDAPKETSVKSINTVFPSHEPCPEHDTKPERRD